MAINIWERNFMRFPLAPLCSLLNSGRGADRKKWDEVSEYIWTDSLTTHALLNFILFLLIDN